MNDLQNDKTEEQKIVKRKKGTVPFAIIVSIIAVFLAVLFVNATTSNNEKKLLEQLNLGEKYLNELNYEQAIAAYKAAISIDTQSVEAYLGLAEVYIAMGDYEAALAILEQGYNETEDELIKEKIEFLANRTASENIINEIEIIYHSENSKTIGMDGVDDETIAQLEKVPDSSITYIAVGGYGNPTGMGVHFQEYAVGVRANPIDGYRYVRCDSETIEFYEYVYNESLEQEVPWFLVPESGKHYIYLYYEPIE